MVIYIAENLIFPERAKYIEVGCHPVRQKVTEDKIIELEHVSSINHLADM